MCDMEARKSLFAWEAASASALAPAEVVLGVDPRGHVLDGADDAGRPSRGVDVDGLGPHVDPAPFAGPRADAVLEVDHRARCR